MFFLGFKKDSDTTERQKQSNKLKKTNTREATGVAEIKHSGQIAPYCDQLIDLFMVKVVMWLFCTTTAILQR